MMQTHNSLLLHKFDKVATIQERRRPEVIIVNHGSCPSHRRCCRFVAILALSASSHRLEIVAAVVVGVGRRCGRRCVVEAVVVLPALSLCRHRVVVTGHRQSSSVVVASSGSSFHRRHVVAVVAAVGIATSPISMQLLLGSGVVVLAIVIVAALFLSLPSSP